MIGADPARPRSVTPLEKGVSAALALLLLLGLCGYLYARLYTPTFLTREGMERVEAARRFATRSDLSTDVVRPLALRYLRPNADASVPDVYQAPLFTLLAGTGIRAAHHLGPNQGDKVGIAFTLLCLAASAVACSLLARSLFGAEGLYLAALVYLLGANALEIALTPGPMPLAAALFTALLAVLARMDVLDAAGDARPSGKGRRAGVTAAVAAGALWGLLFLALYSALLLLPVILYYLWKVTRRDARAMAAFLVTGLLLASPLFLRNYRLTGNPLFHLRLLELVMHTGSFPADSLYRTLGMDQPVAAYLAGGGAIEVARKALGNLAGYWRSLPAAFGLVPLAMFFVAALTRFSDPRINRSRSLVYGLFAAHIAGISLFFPYTEGVPILMMYAPFVAVLGTVFFLNFLRARGLPPLSARVVRGVWIAFAVLPGALFLLTAQPPQPVTSNVYSALSQDLAKMPELRPVLAADRPWEAAFRLDVPAVWLPGDSNEFRDTQNFLNRPVTHILTTSALMPMAETDPALDPWRDAYRFVSSFFTTLSAIEWRYQGEVGRRTRTDYPVSIAEALAGYRPQPVRENDERDYAVVWWRRDLTPPAR